MFVDLIDQLRCPRPHEESWLVASTERMDGRDIVAGVLGCPACLTEYRIVDGVARFGEPPLETPTAVPDEAEAMRLAAFLDLADPRGYAIVVGTFGAHARLLQRLTAVHLLVVNPPPRMGMGQGISGLTTAGPLPLARASARAVALDAGAPAAMLSGAAVIVRPGGRLIAPVSLEVPPGIAELVRDDRVWVGAREAEAPIPLRRG
jgi:uncharacterized protein YbaR (Trm112 family)